MARGGARPGAGRPRKDPAAEPKRPAKTIIAAQAAEKGQTPLEFMLGIMNDGTEDMKIRAQMAVAAAPYVHAKAEEQKPGKKAAAQDRADEINSRFRGVGPPTLRSVK